jgi:hypothetical protein
MGVNMRASFILPGRSSVKEMMAKDGVMVHIAPRMVT